jgi:hypothetical protein
MNDSAGDFFEIVRSSISISLIKTLGDDRGGDRGDDRGDDRVDFPDTLSTIFDISYVKPHN